MGKNQKKVVPVPLKGAVRAEVQMLLKQRAVLDRTLGALLRGYRSACDVPSDWTLQKDTLAFTPPQKRTKGVSDGK